MARLEDLTRGASVRGILPDQLITVIDVAWHGSSVVELTYKDATGRLGSELLYRHREPTLEIVSVGRPWSFDGDGSLLRLVSEAQRIRLAYLFDPRLAIHTSLVCLKLEIRKAQFSVHAPLGDRPYHRVAHHCVPVSMDPLPRLLERRGLIIPFEERPVSTATTEDVERARFELYHRQRYGYELAESPTPLDRLLRNLKLAIGDEGGNLRPTALGLLLFSSSPDRFITGAYVDIAAYRGSVPDAASQLDAKPIRGSVPEQIERTLDYLKTSPLVPVPATKDGEGRLDQPAYSLRALQEAVVNALVHRDYGIPGSQVRVFLFDDRIEVSNPGRLHNTLLPEDLFAGCQPVRRNQMLAGFLREYQSTITGKAYMELRGEGFLAMVRECERVSGRKPDLAVRGDSVKVTIYAGPTPHGVRADA